MIPNYCRGLPWTTNRIPDNSLESFCIFAMVLHTKTGTHVSTSVQCWGSVVRHKSVTAPVAQASHLCCPVSNPRQVMRDLWRTKWQWDRFSPSISFPLPILIPQTAAHSTTIRGGYNMLNYGRCTVGSSLTPPREVKRKQTTSYCRDLFFSIQSAHRCR
jgi:hypothetical protein